MLLKFSYKRILFGRENYIKIIIVIFVYITYAPGIDMYIHTNIYTPPVTEV